MSNNNFLFPKGWCITNIDDIGIINPKSFDYQISDETIISFLPMKCVSEMSGILDLSIIKPYLEIKKGYSKFQNGDLLFAKITPCMENGKITIAKNLVNNVGCGTTEFHIIRFNSKINAEFYRHFFLQDKIRKDAHRKMTGTAGQLRVPISFVKELSIPLPPLNEKHRIVSKIEELFTELDAGIASLKAAQVRLGQYRKAVLKHAFEGKLTEAWRQAHQHEIEPASVLLDRIREERRMGKKKYTELPPVGIDGLPKIPEGWVWVSLEEICDVKPGGTPSRSEPKYWNGEIGWVSSGEVKNSIIQYTKETITELGVLNSNAKINPPGTVLLAMIGEGKTRGQAGLLNIQAATNQNVAAVKPLIESIDPKILFYWFISNYEKNRKVGSGGMQQALNARIIKQMSLPLIPYNEQITIISEIERILSIIQASQNTIRTAEKMSDTLRQSILKKAFEGRLVPQDPNDEPASVLLDRIRQEKLTAEPKKRGVKRIAP